MKPELHIFGLEIPTFGLMVALGVLCCVLILIHLFRKVGASEETIDKLIIVCALSGLMLALGAMFFDALWHNIDEARIHGKFEWQWWGITFSGGIFTAIITYFIIYYFIMKYERHHMFLHFDCIVIGICVAHAFGRIGCFFGGCCYGKVVPEGTFFSLMYPTDNGMENILPTQLYEAIFLLGLFFILLFLVKKNRGAWYLIGYNVFRFFLEYLRGDSRGASPFGFLSPSQFMSIILFLFGLVLLFFRKQIEDFLMKRNVPLPEVPQEDEPTEAIETITVETEDSDV